MHEYVKGVLSAEIKAMLQAHNVNFKQQPDVNHPQPQGQVMMGTTNVNLADKFSALEKKADNAITQMESKAKKIIIFGKLGW